jgi:hypothetical protein
MVPVRVAQARILWLTVRRAGLFSGPGINTTDLVLTVEKQSVAVGVNLAVLVVDTADAEADNEPNHRLRRTVDCEGII